MENRKDIRVRDPFILPYEGKYYLYVTSGERSLSYYVSDDLEHFTPGGVCFEIPEAFWAYKDVWAAEVHAYRGRFYLFVSLLAKKQAEGKPEAVKVLGAAYVRGTQIAVADTPCGPFIPLVDHPATPGGESDIDGSLLVLDGRPYMIYSHDWPDNYDSQKEAFVGEVCAVELSADLKEQVGRPFRLFASCDVPLSAQTPHILSDHLKRYGSDAPFVQKLSDGRLFLTWSPYLNDNYVVLGAVSASGDIHGPWTHLPEPVFQDNGGHAMFFRDNSDRLLMCLHAPEREMQERVHLFEMKEQDGKLVIEREV